MIQVESSFPSSVATKIRRTQSVRLPTSNSEFGLKPRPASPSTSSTSSITSHNVENESETKPLASTSSFQQEIDIKSKPIAEEESRHVHFESSASLIDPMAMTQGERLDPMRDGAFARLRNAMLRYGSAAGVGAAIGTGGFAVKQLLLQNNNNTQLLSTQKSNDQNDSDSDSVSNPFNSD